MDRRDQDKQDIQERDLEDERPGFTPAGRREEDSDALPSTSDRDQPSALGGKVATRSKARRSD